MMRIISILFLQVYSIISLFSQVSDYNLRTVSVVVGDSIIKTQAINHYPKKNVRPQSPYYWYGSGKINVNQGSYSGKLLHGKYEVFDKKNRLIIQGNFVYGLKEGTWMVWFPNGSKKEISVYENGILNGERLLFAPDGKIVSKERFHNGFQNGKSFFYLKDSTIIKEFKDGREIIKPAKKSKEKKQVSIHKRHPVFSRFFKPNAKKDSIPLGNNKNTDKRIIKKKAQVKPLTEEGVKTK